MNCFKMYIYLDWNLWTYLIKEEQRRSRNEIIFGLDSVSADLSSSLTHCFITNHFICALNIHMKIVQCLCIVWLTIRMIHDPLLSSMWTHPFFHLSHATTLDFTAYLFIILGFSFLRFLLFLAFCSDGAYERSMTVCPPPLTMITFSIIEIIMFLIDIIYFRWVIICECKLEQFRLVDFINELHTRVVFFSFQWGSTQLQTNRREYKRSSCNIVHLQSTSSIWSLALRYVYVCACWHHAHHDEFDHSDFLGCCLGVGASVVESGFGLFGRRFSRFHGKI